MRGGQLISAIGAGATATGRRGRKRMKGAAASAGAPGKRALSGSAPGCWRSCVSTPGCWSDWQLKCTPGGCRPGIFEEAFREMTGEQRLSRSAVSRLSERLCAYSDENGHLFQSMVDTRSS
jgi:hypothetical protein